MQSALHPASHGAELMSSFAWLLFVGGGAIFLFVMGLAVYAVVSRPRAVSVRRWIVGGGLVFPAIVLTALFFHSADISTALAHDEAPNAMKIEVVGKRWWWEVRYTSPDGSSHTVLANELRLPVGCVADITLTTDDVIHSFWVPALAGKVDMIPGHRNRLVVHANREGVYRGQCAEFCGGQHAQMAFQVVVESAETFRKWLQHESGPAVEAATSTTQLGREVFMQSGCATCHAIRGTSASGRLGPDLTHVGSRRTLAAGMLDNHAGTMEGWIADSQRLKPGNLMPAMNVMPAHELRALATYLASLQ